MHSTNGVDYPNKCIFIDIVKPERIVFQHVSMPKFQVTVTFEDYGVKTRLAVQMLFESVTEREKIKKLAVRANEQNFDRLEIQLAKMS